MTATNIPDAAIEAGAEAAREEWSGPHSGPWSAQNESLRNGYRALAHAALTAALPHLHPVIETVDDLRKLPGGSVIRSKEGDVWKRVDGLWYFPGLERGCGSEYIDYIFPATVLHMGGDHA